jgi:hypothetical protein
MDQPTASHEAKEKHESFDLQFRYFVAKHLGKTLICIWLFSGLMWAMFQIPQLEQAKKELKELHDRVDSIEVYQTLTFQEIKAAEKYFEAKDNQEMLNVFRKMREKLEKENK